MKTSRGLMKILIGLLFLYLNTKILVSADPNGPCIYLFPSFIGYLLFAWSIKDLDGMEEYHAAFRVMKRFTIAAAILTFTLCVANCMISSFREIGEAIILIIGIVYQIYLFNMLKRLAVVYDSEKDIVFQMMSALIPTAYLALWITPIMILPVSSLSSLIIMLVFNVLTQIIKAVALIYILAFRKEVKQIEKKAAQTQPAETDPPEAQLPETKQTAV